MIDKKITFRYILTAVIAVVFTWIIHEFAHWITYAFLGYDAQMTLNTVSPIGEPSPTEQHSMITSAAGPLITLLQATTVYFFLNQKTWNKYLYPFLFTAFYMRLLAGLTNIINLNDEGRISEYLNIGTFTISIVLSAILLFMVYKISKKYHPGWKFQLVTILIVMLTSSTIILSDQFLKIKLL